MKTQTIGVEIEMTGLTRKAAAETVARHFGTTAVFVGGTYQTYEVKDNGGRIWKLMYDSSIQAQVNLKETAKENSAENIFVETLTKIWSEREE